MKEKIIGKSLLELQNFVEALNEPRFRAAQLYSWVYEHGVFDFDAMTNLSADFRKKLSESASIELFPITSRQISKTDGTTKFLFELADGKKIETVLIPPRSTAVDAEERMTLCVSTQVGCPLDCKFCATATMGFFRNLTTEEILNQFFTSRRQSEKRITNIVFMGMGEPMLNYENVMKAIDLLTDQKGIGISPRRITISTAGYANFIKKMADEDRKVKLALSLHSLNNAVREGIMPITKKYSVEDLLSALEYYYHKTKKSVMFEYIVFDGLNDTDNDVRLLTKAARRFECRVNLIPFHSIEFTNPHGISATLRGASPQGIETFWKKLRANNVPVFIRHSAGVDIDAACGQLAAKEEELIH